MSFEDRMMRVSHQIKLHLEPYESAVFVQSEEELLPGEGRISEEPKWEECPQMLPQTWNVTFADSTSYPDFQVMVPAEKLELVSSLPGFEEITGTVRYESTIQKNREAGSIMLDTW